MNEELCIMPDNPPYIEIWKDIKGYEGLYQVSNLGNVKSMERDTIVGQGRIVHQKEKLMKFTKRSGYYNLILRKNSKRYSKQVHRLVAETFIPNVNNYSIVNHKDFNRLNNCVNNLEWCTQEENVKWSICNMKHSRKRINKLNIQYIRKKGNKFELTLRKKYIGTFNTLEEAINEKLKLIKGDNYYEQINNTK